MPTDKKSMFVTFCGAFLFIVCLLFSSQKIKAKNSYYDTCIHLGYAKAQVDLALYRANPKQYPRFSHLDPKHKGIACGSLKNKIKQ